MIIQCILGVKRASLFSLIPAIVSWTSPALPHSSPHHSESRGSCLSKSGLLSTFILPVSHSNLTWLSGFWTSVHIRINWGAFGDLLAMPIKLESSGWKPEDCLPVFKCYLAPFLPLCSLKLWSWAADSISKLRSWSSQVISTPHLCQNQWTHVKSS